MYRLADETLTADDDRLPFTARLAHPLRRFPYRGDLIRWRMRINPMGDQEFQYHPDDRYGIQGREDNEFIRKDDHGSPVTGDSVCYGSTRPFGPGLYRTKSGTRWIEPTGRSRNVRS